MLKIAGGTVHDPTNRIDGEVRDLWIDGGKMAAAPADGVASRTINASGLVVMPGGVDMHSHIAGPKVTAARMMRPDDRRAIDQALERNDRLRSGTLGSVPSTFATAYKYAGLGYTTVFDAAISPLGARQAHQELGDTPCIDKGFFILLGNNRYAMDCIAKGESDRLREYLGWLLRRTKGYAPKLVNPGGVEAWKRPGMRSVEGLDSEAPGGGLTPRKIIQSLAAAANELALPHPLHLHCNQLGMPGNWSTTLDTMRSLDGVRAHVTHIQYHSYGGGDADEGTLRSQVEPLVDYINTHDNLSVDVGQVMFGATTNMTGDGPLGHYLYRATGQRWCSHDTEVEAGCGVLPMTYRNKNFFNALQWAVGLEWYLMIKDPWRVVMSTDHPNGGSFLAYPQLIRLLMDRAYRQELLSQCPPKLLQRCRLAELDREYTLNEIAIITRAGPAKLLGLPNKGHLAPGADADITILTPSNNYEEMFELPRMVIKAGDVIVDQGEIRGAPIGKTIHAAAECGEDRLGDLPAFFDRHYSLPMEHFGVREDEVVGREVV